MATRSRTAVFKQYRQSVRETSKEIRTSSTLRPSEQETEKTGLMAHAQIDTAVVVVDASSLPPAWVDVVDAIEEVLGQIQKQLTQLESLHRRHLLPGFDDRQTEVLQIDQATRHIATLFKTTQKQLQQFEQPGPGTLSQQEMVLHRNVSTSLAAKIQAKSAEFRKMQSNYLSRLKTQSPRSSPVFQLTDHEDELDPSEWTFTAQQQAQVAGQGEAAARREREIAEIARSMAEIADLFKDMHTLVIDQGTLLDRIDYHMDEVGKHVALANDELATAERTQVSSRKKMLVLLLVLTVAVLVVFLVLKYTGRRSSESPTPPAVEPSATPTM